MGPSSQRMPPPQPSTSGSEKRKLGDRIEGANNQAIARTSKEKEDTGSREPFPVEGPHLHREGRRITTTQRIRPRATYPRAPSPGMEEPFSDECDENDVYMDDEGNISMKDKKSQPKREARPSSPQPDDQQRRSTFRDTIVGRIPEGLATTSTDEGVERSNFLHGALGTNVWYDRSTNRVFAGRTAEDASAWYNGRTDNQTFDVAGNPVYHAAPRGFPRTIAEFIQLRQLARRDKAHSRDRVEAFLLLSAFTEAASRFALHLRDTVMTFAVNNPVAVPYRLEE